ncbi:uncharacterized protein LOC123869306 isoform X1 [Maniola jurtina]|uniref:uncharacterized protein LOC123869306 isoform X1 n=1 Tax=Maniola jurtina TaxID=191418 RepID=UPI001E68C911|nr:uncharacterized protein LOC123869306 isoform X1 [Maniola jurtina]
MSRRQRKSERSLCTPEQWLNAKTRVEAGESKRSVAKSLGMHEATLRKRLRRSSPASSLGRYSQTFSYEMEIELCNYIKKVDSMFYGLTSQKIREIAYNFAERNGLEHRFNKEKKMAGTEWLRLFLKRHPDLSLRAPTSTSVARAIGFNKPQCNRYFENLAKLLDTYKFPPHAIYNMDETGVSTVPNKVPKVISIKGKRCVNKISSAERGINVTLVNAVSAAGNFIPPAFIFPRKRMKAELLDGAPPSSIGMVSDSSYMNSSLFVDWLSHFKDHAKPSKDNPVLLILDNHTSHCTLNAVHFFRENHIHALTIPPHSSHKTQPLDRCIYNSLKIFYASECEKWMRNHPGRVITVYQIAQILTPAYLRAATPANAIQSFKITGIQPFNPDIFGEEDFLASAVTERPLIESHGTQISQSADELPENMPLTESCDEQIAPSVDNLGQNLPSMTEYNEANISKPTNDLVQNIDYGNNAPCNSPQPSCSTNYTSVQPLVEIERVRTPPACSIQSMESPHVPLEDVVPLPRAEFLSRSNRKRAKSDVLSGSPYKLALEESMASKKVPKSVPKPDLKSLPKKAKKLFKVPKKMPKKKVWRCPGCTEIYVDPPAEDWIGCSKCSEWWHEACTTYEGPGNFICRLCNLKKK